jgi:hypothetical protein
MSSKAPKVCCEDILESRLKKGDKAQVLVPGEATHLMLRSEPLVREGNIRKRVPEGSKVTIVDGPACAQQMVWWRVTYTDPDTDRTFNGWMSEGENNRYYLKPL